MSGASSHRTDFPDFHLNDARVNQLLLNTWLLTNSTQASKQLWLQHGKPLNPAAFPEGNCIGIYCCACEDKNRSDDGWYYRQDYDAVREMSVLSRFGGTMSMPGLPGICEAIYPSGMYICDVCHAKVTGVPLDRGEEEEEEEEEGEEQEGEEGPAAMEKAAKAKAPKMKAPEVKAGEVKAPKVKALKVKTGKAKAPKVKALKVKAPKVKALKVKAPKVKAGKAKALKVKTGKAKAPKVKTGKAKAAEEQQE